HFSRPPPELALERRPAMRHGHKTDLDPDLLEPLHRREKRKRPFGFAELPIDAEIGEVAGEPTPEQVTSFRGRLDLPSQRDQIKRRPVWTEQILGYLKAAHRRDALRAHAAFD